MGVWVQASIECERCSKKFQGRINLASARELPNGFEQRYANMGYVILCSGCAKKDPQDDSA